tara:strand:- start:170 stop:556 length:387 start_codon:yes stop_codon:yes gene_type:complete
MLFSCDGDNTLESDSSSTTYNVTSVFNYDDSECLENEVDRTEEILEVFGGIFQIILNDNGTAICIIGGKNAESFSGIWEPTGWTIGEEYRLEGFWPGPGSYLYFDIFETTMTIRDPSAGCTILIFEAE